MKKVISIALVLVLIFSSIPAVYADELDTPVDDPEIFEVSVHGSLSFSGTTANCYGSVTDLGKYIVATMTLTHNGSTVGSWSKSGTSVVVITGSCQVVSGETYTLVVSGTADGVPFSTTPFTRTCP